jgi:hypothetical protein
MKVKKLFNWGLFLGLTALLMRYIVKCTSGKLHIVFRTPADVILRLNHDFNTHHTDHPPLKGDVDMHAVPAAAFNQRFAGETYAVAVIDLTPDNPNNPNEYNCHIHFEKDSSNTPPSPLKKGPMGLKDFPCRIKLTMNDMLRLYNEAKHPQSYLFYPCIESEWRLNGIPDPTPPPQHKLHFTLGVLASKTASNLVNKEVDGEETWPYESFSWYGVE